MVKKVVLLVFISFVSIGNCCGKFIVDDDAGGDFTSIQQAIEQAIDGEVIEIMNGTYYENLDLKGKAIVLTGTVPADPNIVDNTIIDGGGADCVIKCVTNEGPNTIITGLTITNGNAENSYLSAKGGGIRCVNSSPTIRYCKIRNNTSWFGGGGMYCSDCNSIIFNCEFENNKATYGGGGGVLAIHNCVLTISNCLFLKNKSTYQYGGNGGGLYCGGEGTVIRNCTFFGNSAYYVIEDSNLGSGGGLCVPDGGLVEDCIFENNIAGGGGGISCIYGTIKNCTFKNNIAKIGAGIRCVSQSGIPTGTVIDNCDFTNNHAFVEGGAIEIATYDVEINNSRITGNISDIIGGGIQAYATDAVISNCVIKGNVAYGNESYYGGGGIYFWWPSEQGEPICILENTIVCSNQPDQIYGDCDFIGESMVSDICPSKLREYQGDVNADGRVDMVDLAMLSMEWEEQFSDKSVLCEYGPFLYSDISSNGTVDIEDLALVSIDWLKGSW